jgi:hypothetical protein
MKNKYKILILGSTIWSGIGFVRGVNSYKYTHYKDYKNEPYIYSNSIIHGFFGIIMYVNPILLPITIYKELYRLEVNVRNLESEKNSRYYNDLI